MKPTLRPTVCAPLHNTSGITLIPTLVIAVRPPPVQKPGGNCRYYHYCHLLLHHGRLDRRCLLSPLGTEETGGVALVLLKTLEILSEGTVPLLIAGILLVAHWRGVNVFESFIQGAQEGFTTAVRIIPQLVAMFVAIDLLRLSGALDLVTKLLNPLLSLGGVPPDILPLVLTRPLSGSAAFGLTVDLINTHGPDSFIGRLASTQRVPIRPSWQFILVQ